MEAVMLNPQSDILDALYRQQPADAARLADAAPSLTVWEASALGRDAELERLLAADPSLVNGRAPDGHYPLGLAGFFGHASTVRLLLERGANVQAPAQNAMKVQQL